MSVQAQQLPPTGYLRLPQIIGDRKTIPPIPPLIPVSRSTWLEGVKSHRYPQPIKGLGKRITAWRIQDILALIESLNGDVATGLARPQVLEAPPHTPVRDGVERVEGNVHEIHARAPSFDKKKERGSGG
jgi:prophage regulatory protein